MVKETSATDSYMGQESKVSIPSRGSGKGDAENAKELARLAKCFNPLSGKW